MYEPRSRDAWKLRQKKPDRVPVRNFTASYKLFLYSFAFNGGNTHTKFELDAGLGGEGSEEWH